MSLIKASNIPKFDGASFYVWKHRILLCSIIKKLEGIVEGIKIHPSILLPNLVNNPSTLQPLVLAARRSRTLWILKLYAS
jgi:hypothetical protein